MLVYFFGVDQDFLMLKLTPEQKNDKMSFVIAQLMETGCIPSFPPHQTF